MRLLMKLTWAGLVMCLILSACDLTIPSDAIRPPSSLNSAASSPINAAMLSTPAMMPTRKPAPSFSIWGRLANAGFKNERIKASLFFAGQARDGTSRYGCSAGANLGLYTVHPTDPRHLNWSENAGNRIYVMDQMLSAGLNVVSMST